MSSAHDLRARTPSFDVRSRPVRVLIVDDSPSVLAVLHSTLADQPGLVVTATASSAEEGLRTAPCALPDLVLLDLRMPGMGGLAAVPHFKDSARPPLVVLMSLHDDLSLRRAVEQSGADGFMAKPDVSGERLRRLIEELRAPDQLPAFEGEPAHGCPRCDRHGTACRRGRSPRSPTRRLSR
jgi:DNA-binding NarL/FixJ family response regulator